MIDLLQKGVLKRDAFSVCMELGIEEVNVEVVDLGSPEEEIRYLVLNNKQRDKTNEQKAKEAKALKEVESKLALERMTSGINQYTKNSPVANSPHPSNKGKARDIVAKNVGFRSGRETERAIKAIDKIEELEYDLLDYSCKILATHEKPANVVYAKAVSVNPL